MQPAIWWIRRDLRLADNPALAQALAASSVVIPLFILDPALLHSRYHQHAEKRLAFLFASLRSLDADLHGLGSRLVVRQGQPLEVLAALCAETQAAAIYATEDFSPYARQRDAAIAQALPLTTVGGLTVQHPQAILKSDGLPYTIFTPYSRAWLAKPLPTPQALLPAPGHLNAPPALSSLEIALPNLPIVAHFPPGEAAAHRALHAFTQGAAAPIYDYAQGRNRLDWEHTSGLSPYLRFGLVSARAAVVAAQLAIESAPNPLARKGAEAWRNELIWREFYNACLYHFPRVLTRSFRTDMESIQWSNDRAAFTAWCKGRTGYPVVDAAMRHLAATGWMHNRARMITASFLVKDLLIDWRWGERWFMQHLIDGDPAANNGGWQWTAGVGTDAAPYFRVFNPTLQAAKFDPEGKFVRSVLPELRQVPDQFIHEPWKMPPQVQAQAGCIIGQHYPAPIIDHAFARQRVLAAYRQG